MMVPPVTVPTTGPSRGAGASRSSDFFHMAPSLRGRGAGAAGGVGETLSWRRGRRDGARPKGLRAEIAINELFIHTEPFWV
ncbi:hypothetical protein Stsp01_32920 [Streptomyces sp. NBRC 13847]|nr:hypothetical protein Stsp01_32920 [Streptomyces sp. NBRC 13847]